jgi:hypothetical protein
MPHVPWRLTGLMRASGDFGSEPSAKSIGRIGVPNSDDSLPPSGQTLLRAFESLGANGFDVDVERNIRELRDNGLTTIQFEDVIVDLMRPVLPAYSHVLDRAFEVQILGHAVRISSAKGLIVMKVISARPQDETDIQDLLTAYAGKLDMDYVRTELDAFMEASDPRRAKLELWVSRAPSF